ncbi:hypothetical protein D3C86_1875660 [compost metagenome]
MPEREVEALLAQYAVQEVVVGVAGLHAVLARQMIAGDDLFVVPRQVMRLENGLGDLGNGEGLEDAPIGTELEPGQERLHDGPVAGAPEAGLSLGEGRNDS